MRRVFVFLLLFTLPCTGFALSGRNHDNRYYVTDEMWKQHPYNKFVRLTKYSGSSAVLACTAQYVSHNLILSAGHCVEDDKGIYKIRNYKKQTIPVELIYNACGNENVCVTQGNYLKGNDWAIWRIKKQKHFNDDFFNVAIPKTNIQVINAGFGNLRILNDNEIRELKQMLKDMNAQSAHDGNIYDKLSAAMIRKGMKSLRDENLKASTCILDGSASSYSKTLPADCYGWGGNSGGAVISESGKNLYGIIVSGSYTFDNQTHSVTSSRQFQETLRDLIVQNGGTVTNVGDDENLLNTQDIDNSTNLEIVEDEIADDAEEVLGSAEISEIVDKFETDIHNLENELNNNLSNISNMDDYSFLGFLDKTVELGIKKEKLEELQKAYEEAKANEQSLANRILTATTVAATGIGGMELAMGLSEQNADANAKNIMTAYIETMRCTYADGKQVKAGQEEIQLPISSDNMMNYRAEYFALAKDLKERKNALGMKPGIESEEIIDKTTTELYDDESIGITGGAYESIYRAQMLGSEEDQNKIDDMAETSKRRVIGGAVAASGAVVGSTVGNSLINDKLGEMIKENKNEKSISNTNKSVINKLKSGLKSTGMTNVDKLDFSNLDLSSMSGVIDKIDFTSMSDLKGKNATEVLNTSNSGSFTSSFGDILGEKNSALFQ